MRRASTATKRPRSIPDTAESFAQGFFARHPGLRKYVSKRVLDKTGGSGSHPEARQAGDDIWIFPKFWKLDAETRDFVFAHELGHYVLTKFGLSKFVTLAGELGVDVWDNPPFGQANMDEAFADCFATYMLSRAEIKTRYPLWAKIIKIML